MDPQAHQFDRFRRHGDLEALGAVFDATAPKLLRIALHVTGDAHDADDLLQQTFLVAIQRAEEFDAAQPFEAWLVGILRHLTSNLLRRRGRRASREQALPDSVSAAQQRTPAAASESVELRELLRHHIDELPAEQRQVLLLQLEHGLGPAEIARVLEVSPGSVRMRLQRGREALRRLLPAGIASGVVFGAGRSSLAAVRAKTLAAGAAVRPVASGLAVGGSVVGVLVVAMKHWMLAGGAVLALVFAGVWVGMREADSSAPVRVEGGGDARALGLAVEVPSEGLPATRREIEDPVDVGTATDPGNEDGLARLFGRVVDEGGNPVGGVAVVLTAHWRERREREMYELDHGRQRWSGPEPVRTSAEGLFEFRFDPPPLRSFKCSFAGPDLVPVERGLLQIEPGESFDLGTVILSHGATWSGRVVDESGDPQGGLRISLTRSGKPVLGVDSHVSAETDEHGRYTASSPVLPGEYEPFIASRKILRPAGSVILERGGAPVEVIVAPPAADTRARIHGRVVDEDGRPVHWVHVHSERLEAHGFGNSDRPAATTDPRGRFELIRPAGFEHETETMASVFKDGYEVAVTEEPVRWGSDDVVLRLLPGPPLEIRVARADDGAPVERFGITMAPVRGPGLWSSDDLDVHHAGEHGGGLLRIPRVSPARYRVDVVSNAGSSVSGPQEIEVLPGRVAALEFVLQSPLECVVEVVDSEGRAVVDVPVEVLRHQGGGELSLRMPVVDADVAALNGESHLSREEVWRTDAEGRVTIHYAPGPGVGLRLPGPGNLVQLVQPLPSTAGETMRVVVDRGARLSGEIGPAAFRDWALGRPVRDPSYTMRLAARLHGLEDRRGETLPMDLVMSVGIPVDADGHFEISGVPAGVWSVSLRWLGTWIDERGRIRPGNGESMFVVDRLVVGRDDEIHLPIDLSRFVPSPVVFDITVDGAPRRVDLVLRQALGKSPFGYETGLDLHEATDGEGRAQLAIPKGTWSVEVGCRIERHRVVLRSQEVEVSHSPNGPPQRFSLDFRTGRGRFRFLQPDGTPAAGLEVLLQPEGSQGVADLSVIPVTDSEGRAAIVAYPCVAQLRVMRRPFLDPRDYRVWREAHPGAPPLAHLIDLGAVNLVPGEPEEIEMRLPDSWTRLPD